MYLLTQLLMKLEIKLIISYLTCEIMLFLRLDS